MHGMDKKLTELHGMLKVAEQDIKKGTHQVLMVQKSAKFKKSWSKKKAKAKGTRDGNLRRCAEVWTVLEDRLLSLQGDQSLEEEL